MKRRMTICLMVMLLLFSGEMKPVFADAAAVTNTMTATESLREGFLQPEIYEVENGIISEIYQEKETAQNGKGSAVYQSSWDCYSSNYYYNMLSEKEQAFWDKLDAMCYEYLMGTAVISPIKDKTGKQVYPTKTVISSGISAEQAKNTALMFKYSNPQYYFLDIGVYWGSYGINSTITFAVFPAFADGAKRASATAVMKAKIDTWMAKIKAEPDVLSKEKMAHDLICKNVKYDHGYQSEKTAKSPYHQVAYSVFCEGYTVCAGYSQAMQLLMNGAGIDCAVVTSSNHEWNIIRLNHTWYYLDLTWNDTDGDEVMYQYFNRSQQIFMSEKALTAVESHTPEKLWNGYLPQLIYDSNATADDWGSLYEPTLTLEAPKITYTGNVVTLTAPKGGTIYYTTDGTKPSIAFTKADRYTAPFSLSGITKIKAITVANGCIDSSISEATVVPEYTVTFHANGGYIEKKSVTKISKVAVHGTKMGKLSSPKRKGYAFLGWYTKKSGGSKIDSNSQILKTASYYARWAKMNPKKAVISSVKSSKAKTMKVCIKKMKTANGYQIRYSLKKNMSGAKKKGITENTSTIKNLKKGKTYYVQVRMYQRDSVSGKKKYGAWSSVKQVKIKKK